MTREQRFTLLATIIGSGIVILDSTVVNLALPHISKDLGTNFAGLQWIVDGYLLSLSALILLGGSLGDIFGRKKMYLLGLVGFGVMSLLCGLAPNTLSLIVARILQGIFGALLVPGGLAIISTNFVAKDRGGAIGSWSAWSAIFAALGPILGGYLLDVASWRWIFLINVPFVIICYALGVAGIKEGRDKAVRRVDVVGAGLAMLALAGLTYGLIEGPGNHWHWASTLPLAAGVLLSAAFIWQEQRSRDPMVRLNLFRSSNFSGSNLMTFCMYGALSGFLFALVIYLQTTLHYSSIKAGLSLLPVTIFLMLFSKRIGLLSGKIGPKLFMVAGPLIAAVGILLMLRLGHDQANYFLDVLPGVIVFAVGLTLLVAPLTTTVMTSVHDDQSGIASGINNAVARVAGLVVIAVLGIFGADDFFRFSIILCTALAALGGLVSFLMVSNPRSKPVPAKSSLQ